VRDGDLGGGYSKQVQVRKDKYQVTGEWSRTKVIPGRCLPGCARGQVLYQVAYSSHLELHVPEVACNIDTDR
jgi:hypothetical protein